MSPFLAAAIVLTAPVMIDGDTLRDGATIYRLENIDAPESFRRAKCPAEAARADRATREAWRLILSADSVTARPIGRIDAYGRTVAFITLRISTDEIDLGQALMDKGLAAPWRGHHHNWCAASGD